MDLGCACTPSRHVTILSERGSETQSGISGHRAAPSRALGYSPQHVCLAARAPGRVRRRPRVDTAACEAGETKGQRILTDLVRCFVHEGFERPIGPTRRHCPKPSWPEAFLS